LIRSIKRLVLAGVAAATLSAMAFAGPASASVTIDPATGTGFVGKGDVQTAFGWNNAKLQEAGNLVFTSVSNETWEWDEVWDTGNGRQVTHHVNSKSISTSVSTSLADDNRVRNQVTGIFLNGFLGEPVVTGGEHPVNDQVIVDRAVQRANGNIYPPTPSRRT
jgi:hypothetical protein